MIIRQALVPDDVKTLATLMETVGWIGGGHAGASQVASMIAGSTWFSVAEVDGQVAGYARALSDNISMTYLVEVAVAERCRRRGIATALIQSCLRSFSHTALYADVAPGAVSLVSKLGLKPRPAHLVACARSPGAGTAEGAGPQVLSIPRQP